MNEPSQGEGAGFPERLHPITTCSQANQSTKDDSRGENRFPPRGAHGQRGASHCKLAPRLRGGDLWISLRAAGRSAPRLRPRIEQGLHGHLKIRVIAGDERQVMDLGRGGNERIHGVQGPAARASRRATSCPHSSAMAPSTPMIRVSNRSARSWRSHSSSRRRLPPAGKRSIP